MHTAALSQQRKKEEARICSKGEEEGRARDGERSERRCAVHRLLPRRVSQSPRHSARPRAQRPVDGKRKRRAHGATRTHARCLLSSAELLNAVRTSQTREFAFQKPKFDTKKPVGNQDASVRRRRNASGH